MTIARSIARPVASPVAKSVTGGSSGGGGGDGSFDYIGANALSAYGIGALKTGADKAFRVRRDSDNTEQDCLTLAEAVTFCGGGSGFITTWYDQSGNAKNQSQGTTTLQPRVVNSGASDGGLVFDGSNDFTTLGARVTSGSITQFSFAGWIKTSSSGVQVITGEWIGGTNNASWVLYTASGKLVIGLSGDGGAATFYTFTSTDSVNTGAWVHIAVTYNATTPTLYINGAAASGTAANSLPTSLFNTSAHYRLGCNDNPPAFLFTGSMFSALMYSVELTASQVLALKNAVTPS